MAQTNKLKTYDEEEFVKCLKVLIKLESDLIIPKPEYSLYIRPVLISTTPSVKLSTVENAKLFVITSPVKSYYSNTIYSSISLIADTQNVRAWPGGTGSYKMSCNYAPTILPLSKALNAGHDQILWLFDNKLSEAGTMNIFIFWKNKEYCTELITPSLDGTILPGITRDSILTICRQWNEFKVSECDITIDELESAVNEGRVIEVFGTGTAVSVVRVGKIAYNQRTIEFPANSSQDESSLTLRLYKHMCDLQTGVIESDWVIKL